MQKQDEILIKQEIKEKIENRLNPKNIALFGLYVMFFMLLIILLSTFANADITTDLTHRYPLTSNGNDVIGTAHFTNYGADFSSGEYGDFTSAESDYMQASVSEITPAIADDFTVCYKISYKSAEPSGVLVELSKHWFYSWYSTGVGSRPEYGTATKALYDYTTNPALDTFYSICTVKSSTTVTIYWDGVSEVTATGTWGTASATGSATMGKYSTSYIDAKIKELCVWDRALDSTDLSDYTSGGCAITSTTPTLTLNTNLVNNTINYNTPTINFYYNGTFTLNTIDLVNISFFQNGVLNTTLYDVNLSNNNLYNVTLPSGYEGYYNISFNASNYEVNATSGVYIYNVDLVEPKYSFNLANNTQFFKKIDYEITAILTGNDTNLYYMNLSLLNSTGQTLNMTEKEPTSQPYDEINFTFNVSSLPQGNYTIPIFLADSHTAKEIETYKTDKIKDGYEFEEKIKITSPDLKTMKLNKEKDRYSFDMEFNKEEPEIYVECEDLRYLPDSNYEGHLICWADKKWIDFEEDSNTKVNIEKIGKNKVKVTPQNKDQKIFRFNSIGDLNIVDRVYSIEILDSFGITAKDIITNTTINTFNVEVYHPGTLAFVQERNTTTGTVYFNVSGNYFINVSSSGYINNETNLTFTSGVVESLTLTAAESLYFNIYDEQTNRLINDRNVTLDVINYENVSTSYTITNGITFLSGFSAGFYEINYKADNYTARSYYTTISTGSTQLLDLYLLSSEDATHQYKNIEVLDESASSLSNATVKMQRYFIEDNSWKIVEMTLTNDEGKGFLFAELYDATYRFVIDYDGQTQKTTAQTKLDTRDLFFSINLIESGMQTYYDLLDATTSLSYDNSTGFFSFDYNAGTVTLEEARLLVYEIDDITENIICNNTLVAQSGGITCNMTLYTSEKGEYFAQGFLRPSINEQDYLVATTSRVFVKDFETYGLTGFFMAFLVVGTLAFIGLYNPAVAIALSLFGLILTKLIGILFLDYVWLIGIVIVGIIYMLELKT